MSENKNNANEIVYKPTKKKGGRTHQFTVYQDGEKQGVLDWKRSKQGSGWIYTPEGEGQETTAFTNLKEAHAQIPSLVGDQEPAPTKPKAKKGSKKPKPTEPAPEVGEDPAPEGEEPEAQPKAEPEPEEKPKPKKPKVHMLEEFGDADTFLTAILTVRKKGRNAVTAGDWETTAPEGDGEYNIVKVDRSAGRVTISTPSGKYPATPSDGAGFVIKKAAKAAGPKEPVQPTAGEPEEPTKEAPKPRPKSDKPRKGGLYQGDYKSPGLQIPKGATERQSDTIHWMVNRMCALNCFVQDQPEDVTPDTVNMELDDGDGSITVALTKGTISQTFVVKPNGATWTAYTTRYGKERIAQSRGWVLKARLTAQDTPLDKKGIGSVGKWIEEHAE